MSLKLFATICCTALLASACAPLTGLLNWEATPSEFTQYGEPKKRVPLPPTVQDFEDAATPPVPDDM